MPNTFEPRRPNTLTSSTRTAPPELVDPAFLLKAIGLLFVVALILAYATLVTIYSVTQWQLVLHPSRVLGKNPEQIGLSYNEVYFGTDNSGEPQLNGWWMPSETPAAPTALLLHGGSGTMSDALPAAMALHNANLNVLLFDYRGFGKSGGKHPSQAAMQEDAEAGLNYILAADHASPGGLVVYGIGLGAPLAVRLAAQHPGITAIVLEEPDGDTRERATQQVRSHVVPVGLLFHEDFSLAAPLSQLATPKLLIAHSTGSEPALFQQAAAPKMTVEMHASDMAALDQALARFFDSYLPHQPQTLLPAP